jgi:hypothetical protein
MGLLDRIKKLVDSTSEEEEYTADLARETARVRAYRAADEVAEAARLLSLKALELRAEIEAMSHE